MLGILTRSKRGQMSSTKTTRSSGTKLKTLRRRREWGCSRDLWVTATVETPPLTQISRLDLNKCYKATYSLAKGCVQKVICACSWEASGHFCWSKTSLEIALILMRWRVKSITLYFEISTWFSLYGVYIKYLIPLKFKPLVCRWWCQHSSVLESPDIWSLG